MKQSTKLLSLVLAIIMAFSCVSVIGSAAKTITTADEMAYDSIDDALLTPEQVADIALDLVDGLLADLEVDDDNIISFDLLGKEIVIINLNSVNLALSSLIDLTKNGLFGTVQSLAGDAKELNFDSLKIGDNAIQRSDGNIKVVRALLGFLNDNTSLLKKAPYGIMNPNTDKDIDLGRILDMLNLFDTSEINELLDNLDVLIGGLVYDLVLYGSYRHQDMDAEELEAAGQPLPYGGSLDHMLENALLNLVVDPQDKDDESETGWDENAILIPSLKAQLGGEGEPKREQVLADLDLNSKSVFDVINYVAQYAIDDLGVNALNHNLKKGLMEAVEVEFVEIDKGDVPADVMTVFDNEAAYTTYISYDCMQKSSEGEWYYTTKKTQDKMVDGKPVVEDGKVLTERVSVYYKANTALANEFYDLIEWDYNILKSTDPAANSDATKGLINCINYNSMISDENATYGSLVESLNHLVYIVYTNALKEEVRADFEYVTGSAGWVDGSTTEKINDNLNNLIKYLLVKFPGMIFGKNSVYALEKENYETEKEYFDAKYKSMSLIDIVALIGPSFFEDVMPQLVMPVDENGAYAFAKTENGQSVALLQFGALVLREFMTEIAPNVNYDAYIFADGTLTSAEGRQFATHSAEEWFNIILNMGVDVGYTYLYNITNFGDKFAFVSNGTAFEDSDTSTEALDKIALRDTTLPVAPKDANEAMSEERWKNNLDDAIDWAAGYVGQGSNGVLAGINPDALKKFDGDPFAKLSYVLNTILPLGFVNGCNTYDATKGTGYDLDVEVVFNKLKSLLTTFDFTELSSLFGRNTSNLKRGNILAQPVIPMVLNLVNDILALVFNTKLLNDTTSLDNVILQSNLSILIERLFPALYTVSEPLLLSALPVVGKLIKGWGTEQNFSKPDINAPSVVQLSGGTTAETTTITVKNGANGIWRSWVDANGTRQYDEQYQIELTDIKFIDFETNQEMSTDIITEDKITTGKINYGDTGSFNLKVSGLNESKIVRMDVSYKVYEGDVEMVKDAVYTDSVYSYLTAVATDENKEVISTDDNKYSQFGAYTAQYFDINQDVEALKADIEERPMLFFRRHKDNYGIGSGKGDKGKLTITLIEGSDAALTPGKGTTADEFGENNTRNFDPIKIFVNGDYTCTGDETDKTLNIAGANINTTELAKKKSGDVTTFKFQRHEEKADSCGVTNYDANVTLTMVFMDRAARDELTSATQSEIRRGRVEDDYLTTGYSYADRVLATETVKDEETGEVTYKETNSPLTAWVDANGEPLADGIVVTPDAKNEEIGTYEIDGQKYSAKLVTKINNSNATNAENGKNVWATYVAAVKAAAKAGLDPLNAAGDFNYEKALSDLNAAATDLSYCEADVESDPTVANAIDHPENEEDLKGLLNSIEAATTDKYDYTDYMMWRLNRLNDARDDAAYYINLKKDADREYKNVDKKFPYTSIEKDDLTALVALTENEEEIADKGYSELILALLEDLSEEEAAAKKAWLDARDDEYVGVTAFDIALAKSMLEKTSARLRNRDYKENGKADTTYLATEIASCKAMFTDSSLYTEKSWNRYAKALADAEAVVNGDSQKDAFDKKWELLCCRNELVLVEEAADYSELEALIEQAKFALAHQTMYDNTKKELGQVLAELGIEGEVVTADGYGINLFPGSALYTSAEPYTKEDQDIIDDAADDLKEALARLKFKDLGIAAVEGNGDVDYSGETTIVFDDLNTKDVDESVVVKLATIGAGMNEDAVKALFNVTATGATVGADNVTVSNDRHYSIDKYVIDEETGEKVLAPFQGFAGTNSVVTFYTVQDGIKIPVATIKLVVNGDINGDGTVDVIDAAQMHLATNNMATLEGCYFVAGNLAGATDATRVIDGDDYTQVINAVVGPEAA